MSGTVSRPGLRERRLSRVHFDGDETPIVEQLSLETPQPLAIQAGEQDSGKQDYFDAPTQQQPSPAKMTDDEENRGRPSNAGPSPIRPDVTQVSGAGILGHPRGFVAGAMVDISPRSTGFSAPPVKQSMPPARSSAQQATAINAAQWQQSPRGLEPAHVRGSPQMPLEPFHGAAMYANARTGTGEWIDDGRERRASAPAAEYGSRDRAATYVRPGQGQTDIVRGGASAFLPAPYAGPLVGPAFAAQQPVYPGQHQGDAMYRMNGMLQPAADYAQYAMYALPPAGSLPPCQSPVQQQRQPALKPALRRTQTEEEARRTTRNAVDIVHSHTQGLRQRRPGQEDDMAMEKSRNAGVLSNLLQLYGTSSVPRRSNSADSKWEGESNVMSRATSAESHRPVASRRGMQRMESSASMATTLYEEDLDQYDPRIREKSTYDDEKARSAPPGSRMRRYSYSGGDDAASIRSKRSFKDLIRRRRSFALDEDAVYSDLTGKRGSVPVNSQTRKRRLSITKHVAGKCNFCACCFNR